MKIEDSVPNTTPRIIANEKLRMLSPPRKKIQSNTSNVVEDVLIVRDQCLVQRVVEYCPVVTLLVESEVLTYTVEHNHLIVD